MRLQERLDNYRRNFLASSRVTPEIVAIMRKSTEALCSETVLKRVLKQGQLVPSFELPNSDGKLVSSTSLLAKGPLVVSFFRGVW